MKIVHVNILMVILFSATLVSFSYAGSSCCPGAGCCDTTNVSGGQQQLRASSGGPSQTKVGTVKKPAPQINPMPWSATVNQIGTVRLHPLLFLQGAAPEQTPRMDVVEANPNLRCILGRVRRQ